MYLLRRDQQCAPLLPSLPPSPLPPPLPFTPGKAPPTSPASAEGDLAHICEELTNSVAPVYKTLAPDSFNNMALFDGVASDCRIGAEGKL